MSSSWLLWLTRTWLALAAVALLAGHLKPPGLEGLGELRSWWTARRYEQAGLERNLPRMAELGEDLLHQRGEGAPAEFAGYLLAWAAPSPSMGYSREESAALASQGRIYLRAQLPMQPAPWPSLQILANSLVLRSRLGQEEAERLNGLSLYASWMAAGGGLVNANLQSSGAERTAAAYRDLLRRPAQDRPLWLASRLQGEDALPLQDTEQLLAPVFGDTGQR